jgi:hypothetical protein
VSACFFVSSLAGWAQDRPIDKWEAEVRLKLTNATQILHIFDVKPLAPPYVGSMEDNEYFDVRAPLQRGVIYSLIGVCDSACGHLTMELFDEEGSFYGRSLGTRTVPLMIFVPPQSGRYTARIFMQDCADDYCNYGLGVYLPRS